MIPFLSVLDNVALLPMLAGKSNREARKIALELLQALDIAHRVAVKVSQLSGGEQQRIAIARALANQTAIILADVLPSKVGVINKGVFTEMSNSRYSRG